MYEYIVVNSANEWLGYNIGTDEDIRQEVKNHKQQGVTVIVYKTTGTLIREEY